MNVEIRKNHTMLFYLVVYLLRKFCIKFYGLEWCSFVGDRVCSKFTGEGSKIWGFIPGMEFWAGKTNGMGMFE